MTTAYQIEQLYLFIFSLLLATTLLVLAKKKGFFVLPLQRKENPLSWKEVFFAFSSYFFLAIVLLPIFALGAAFLFTGNFKGIKELPFLWQGLIQEAALVIVFLWFIAYSFLIKKEIREFIYWGSRKVTFQEKKKSVFIGLLAFVLSYPLMMVVSILVGFLSYLVFKKAGVEQLAVQQLKMTLGHPLLFILMVITVVFLVPFVEELLFRGFLQSWLKKFVSRPLAVIITAFIFALVHFSPSQGVGNIELIAALFVLACFLGFIYERERNLLASIVMHGTFNGFSALMIALTSTT